MEHHLEALLLAALVGALLLYVYDLYVSGPEWSRLLPPLVGASGTLIGLGYDRSLITSWPDTVVYCAAGTFAAVLLVAVLQLLQVKRDAAMTAVLRRGR